MRLGLQFAMPKEMYALPGMKERRLVASVSGVDFYEVTPDIIACVGGVSKVNAAMAAEILCVCFGVDMILNAGIAGCALDLPLGTVVVASDFVQHDVDTTAVGDEIGMVSTVNRVSFPAWEPERCVQLLQQMGIPAELGRVATGDWFAKGWERSRGIVENFHPTVVEMEGAAIAQVCLRNEIPCVGLKVVSDHMFAENQTDEYHEFCKKLEERFGRVTLELALALQKEF